MRLWGGAYVFVLMVAWTAGTVGGAGREGGPGRIDVPAGTGVPVITDGTFTQGEWDDALRIPVSDEVTLLVKEHGGVVFVGVHGSAPNIVGPSELSIAPPGGPIVKLHVSFGLYEVVLPPTGAEPKARLGFTSGWYANEIRKDDEAAERLRNEGKPPFGAIYPSEGIEFAIRRSKVPGGLWRLRLWASAIVRGAPGALTYPSDAADRVTDDWLELRFK